MEKKNPLLIKKHWHLVVWEVASVGLPQKISTYMATRKRMASIPEIRAARDERQVPPNGAVLVCINYLGYGTQCDLTGESPVPEPSRISEDFLTGMNEALHCIDPSAVVNPFDNEQHDVHRAQEWQLGFANGTRLRKNTPHAVAHHSA